MGIRICTAGAAAAIRARLVRGEPRKLSKLEVRAEQKLERRRTKQELTDLLRC